MQDQDLRLADDGMKLSSADRDTPDLWCRECHVYRFGDSSGRSFSVDRMAVELELERSETGRASTGVT